MLFLAMGVTLSGCQVTPLYSDNGQVRQTLPSMAISPAKSRIEQVVRNELVFLTKIDTAASNEIYDLQLNVSRNASGTLDAGTDENFTAGRMVVSGQYTLANSTDSETLYRGARSVTAQYDLPTQEYAKIRALQDAENRAARELAALIAADLALALNK